MFGFGEDKNKKKKKSKKPKNVFRKSKTKGYKDVHQLYLFDIAREMEIKTFLRDASPSDVSPSRSSSVQMVESLMCWMSQRTEPFWTIFGDKGEWRKWIALREDHWIVNEEKRIQLLKEKKI